MIINNNIGAMNAHRQMGSNQEAQQNSMEKLSSGLRINSASDDAAGLAISEKMRGQIRGLEQADRNAQDGVSMIQTAEGALNESHSILQRMRELSVQSSNDTNTESDRAELQKEFDQLSEEITRIGDDTEFNTQKLIDGSISSSKVAGADNAAVAGSELGAATSGSLSADSDSITTPAADSVDDSENTVNVDGAQIKFSPSDDRQGEYENAEDTDQVASLLEEDINKGIDEYNSTNGTEVAHVSVSDDGEITSGTTGNTSTISAQSTGGGSLLQATGVLASDEVAEGDNGLEGAFSESGAAAYNAIGDGDTSTVSVDGVDLNVEWGADGDNGVGSAGTNPASGDDMTTAADEIAADINTAIGSYNESVPSEQQLEEVTTSVKDGSFVVQSGSEDVTSSVKFDDSESAKLMGLDGQSSATQGGGVEFQIGANAGQDIQVNISDMRSEALGVADLDITSGEGAQEALTAVNDAIEQVSAQRSDLGATQNRLEHTINNLGTSAENLQSAESRIRDVDMAAEMMENTKSNILSQASQSMLAQANQQPQSVLQLLQ